jgi:hypothetical protein
MFMGVLPKGLRLHRWRRAVAVGASAALVALAAPGFARAASAAPAPSQAQAQASQNCTRVEFLGARGSGQPLDTAGPYRGFGPEAYKVVATIAAKLSPKKITYGEEASTYPADTVTDLRPTLRELAGFPGSLRRYYRDHVQRYLSSISTGVDFVLADVKKRIAACGDAQKLVLVGYSQGAMVLHQAEDYLYAHDRAALGHIIGTVLIADGDRVPNSKARRFGSAAAGGEGLQVYLRHFSDRLDVPLPATTASLCNAGDLVCDFGIPQLVRFPASAKVHMDSYADCTRHQCSYSGALTSAADWMAGVVLAKV